MDRETKTLLWELLGALSDEKISEAQFEELDRILCEHPEARQIYRDYLAVDDRLASGEMLFGEIEHEEKQAGLRIGGWRLWAAAAALVVAGFVLNESFRGTSDSGSGGVATEGSEEPSLPAIASVKSVIGAGWAEGQRALEPGEALQDEWIHLEEGVVQLEFGTGAQVSLEGPASLQVVAEGECFLERGRLVVLAPAEIGSFKVNTRTSELIDLGTEFAVDVNESGEMVVHVLDGEVEVGIQGAGSEIVSRERLVELQAARLEPGKRDLQRADYAGPAFEHLRAATLWRERPLRIQFDCGSYAGSYQGDNSPAHAAGDMRAYESFWNALNGDLTGRFVMSDGEVAPYEIEIDYGRRDRREFSWDREPDVVRAFVQATRGVFDTALGKDHLGGGGEVGVRLRGLPKGAYRVYLVARAALDHQKWGNYLVTKAYKSVVTAGEADLVSGDFLYHDPLSDPDAQSWVRGQTHVVAEVEISGPDEYLTIRTKKDRERSPKPGGGNSVITAIQIIELRK
jgi:ferric-dicitrate binding protein FerR (iron transport regulator)